jgi:hypothetical protein
LGKTAVFVLFWHIFTAMSHIIAVFEPKRAVEFNSQKTLQIILYKNVKSGVFGSISAEKKVTNMFAL